MFSNLGKFLIKSVTKKTINKHITSNLELFTKKRGQLFFRHFRENRISFGSQWLIYGNKMIKFLTFLFF
uniref:Uncharacterized protein n=1 Tax=Chlorella vulgaris TaxID=3077 RepID=V9H0Y0_CHLVU|nr:hypothetical protein ChvulCp020 [Chlorella vulgaris]pir/T07208/ hypothetical protein 68 - Chlorella vulgaris chloroplast [Chlorella vulgaris]BAA57855.1 unnamed protein product [Chlorella vulgaris]